MRVAIVLLLACLAGCSGDPRAMGITGPGKIEPPAPPSEDLPGGQVYPRDMMPNTGNGNYWGYN